MKKQLLLVTGILSLAACFCLASAGSAAAQSWEEEFSRALAEIQEVAQASGEGLAYTRSPEDMLDEAIDNAMAQGGGGCQILKMAVDTDFNPYSVLLSIYSRGGVDLDEICMCATDQGISKAVIAQAATSAAGPGGEPAYTRDEVTQAQCLQEGLPYTPAQAQPPPQPLPPDPVPPDSVSTP